MPQQETLNWRKSSHSGGNGECVEVAWPEARVAVRDSKNTTGPTLDFPPVQWHGFLSSVTPRSAR
ncbi:DUF397 domain-containing protein [Umezawaea sp. Da 62-37]|uniref:DUF397 domain-containing protein n=1 Tax=Umezawaea sp. Da 62-37 TaxID=3075927 RepID=UPI0028F6D98E|nr:DUF397 domain-containing protein [Umezawaea sp. Da 62-37]WNV89808.1 DUF397 domain-containing protein [Umezawaea sp. Da 62-37]